MTFNINYKIIIIMYNFITKFRSINNLFYNEEDIFYLYFPLIKFKDFKIIERRDKLIKPININKLNNLYKNYVFIIKAKNIVSIKDINKVKYRENYLNNININNLNITEKKNFLMKLYINEKIKNNKRYKLINNINMNLAKEGYRRIELKEISNRLSIPYYFFTAKYNEKIIPSQNRSWYNSVYNFIKFEKSEIKYRDIYTNKLIKLFFNLRYFQRKKIWDTILLDGLKIKPNVSIVKNISNIIKYTSTRSSWSLKNLTNYPKIMLTFTWLIEQIKFSSYVKRVISEKKEGIITGLKINKKNYIHKLDKIFISKPSFKHTPFNVIIDLFIYNNKTNKLQKFENMLSRRILYKYMYSMYINYLKKIKETMNRPRFFYLNIIEPKTFNYYSNILKLYENILVINNKKNFYYLCFLLLKWNLITKNIIENFKNKNILFNLYSYYYNKKNKNDVNDNEYIDLYKKEKEKINILKNRNIVYKRWIFYKNKNITKNNNINNILTIKNKINKEGKEYNSIYDINKKIFNNKKEKYIVNSKKTLRKKSKYEINKKYYEELEWRSNNPVDTSKLTLWSRKGLGNIINNDKSKNKKIKKHFRHNKFSLEQYKKKIYYAKGKTKRKIAPNLWKQKLMSFFLFSRAQKKDSNPNRKFFDLNNKFINNNLNLVKLKNNKYQIINQLNNKNSDKLILEKKKLLNKNKDNNNKLQVWSNKIISLSEKNLNKLSITDSMLDKKIYLNYNNNLNDSDKNILNISFINFFININKKINKFFFKDKNNIVVKITKKPTKFKEYKNHFILKRKNYLKKNKSNNFNNMNNNIKIIWDNLDFSIIKLFNNILKVKNNNFNFNVLSFNNMCNKINKYFNNHNDLWYVYLIKKEFYFVNRDVLLFKVVNTISEKSNVFMNNYKYDYNMYDNLIFNYKNDKGDLNVNIWFSNLKNKRNNNINENLVYNGEIFKPYYRQLIPLFIYQSYKSFILFLNSKNNLINFKNKLIFRINWTNLNNVIILNYIIVKTLLNLMHYNYRSLLRVKPKYYYLNKLRYYGTKVKKLNFNTWMTSIKYIKKLRKTPRHFWLRYHKLASFYYNRIIQNAELDTKRKILLPFIFYFEDLLFNIYGKWGIIRLWPLKRFYLNSFILAERIMFVILSQNSSSGSISEYRQNVRNLINILRWSQVNKLYNQYNENKFRWPENLINIMKNNNIYQVLNYSTLEYYNGKLEKTYILSTYPLNNDRINNYLSSVNFNYINVFKESLNSLKNEHIKKRILYNYGKINKIRYINYWLKPLHNYLIQIKNHLDISGVKFKLTGRPGVVRSNIRSFTKTYLYGNLLGPKHFNYKLLKTTSLSNSLIRGTIKSNIDYDSFSSKSNNGSITLKIWMSSIFSSDIHELLLYLLRIKNLYNELVNRYYLVSNKFANSNYYYAFDKVSELIELKKKINKKNSLTIKRNKRF